MSALHHEQLYRSTALMAKIRTFSITICGAGALGANLTENLARSGFLKLRCIDQNRVQERHLSTQPYFRDNIGAYKARILANNLYRALGVTVEIDCKTLNSENVHRLLKDSCLVIDAFDSHAARGAVQKFCQEHAVSCLHVGLAGEVAEVIWNDIYQPPVLNEKANAYEYPLARNLVLLAVVVTSETVIKFVESGIKQSYQVNLRDFAVNPIA